MMRYSNKPDMNSFTHLITFFKVPAISLALLMLLFISSIVLAETKIEMEETEITGARELPKILYIVPWKKTRPGGDPLPMHSLIDEALSPIDVDVFKRQVRYYDMTRSPTTAEK